MPLRHPALPPVVSLPWIAFAAAVWVSAGVVTAVNAPDPLAPGSVSGDAVLLTDPLEGRFGHRAVADTVYGDLLFEIEDVEGLGLVRGVEVRFEGSARGYPGRLGGHRYRARVSIGEIAVQEGTAPIHVEVGRSMRDRVMGRLEPLDSGRGLLAGFLIGDISGLSRSDAEAMRLAGLSHFVAVSGSNVALFLGLAVFVAGPLALGPKRRALVGLAAVPIYAAATRFEPSVMRASVMAALALGGKLIGVVFEAWQLLSLAVVVLLSVQPALTSSAGFQLSVAATAGVLVGARWPVKGGRVGRALAVTIGAQAAVAPLILMHFGSVPLLSPLVNLLAGPIVATSTLIGAVGVAGPGFLVDVAAWLADAVLFLARGAERWPQLGVLEFISLVALSALGLRLPRARPAMAAVGLVVLAMLVLGLGRSAPDSSVVVLDVGQGDAILIHGGEGRFALVDGGPDEVRLASRLHDYGVSHLELVILTHVHADHAAGLKGLVGRVGIGRFWARAFPHETEASRELISALEDAGIPMSVPRVGHTWQLGGLSLVVEAPIRRYASPNDQSIVMSVRGDGRTMLLSGDIEIVAQSELGHLRADVLKVPHQGAATSDPEWLRGVGAELAVISVGPNQFGHPAGFVIEALEEAGADVVRTDEQGDVVVSLG